MAFGFPAYHYEILTFNATEAEIIEAVTATYESLGWKLVQKHDKTGTLLQVRTINGSLTFSERVLFKWKGSKLLVRSECIIPTQVLDFGKNKRNVEAFVDAVKERIELVG